MGSSSKTGVEMLRQIIFSLLLLFNSTLALAADLVVERSWVEDPQGSMTLAQVQAAQPQPMASVYFNKGFQTSTFWIRLRLDPAQAPSLPPDTPLVIRIRPVYLDDIQLFDPLSPTDKPRHTGDRHAWMDDEYQSLNLNFQIPLGAKPREIWLRLTTTTSTLSAIRVLTDAEAKAVDWQQAISSILLMAVLFICLGWGVLAWLLFRDRLIKLYIVREVVALAYAFAVLGGLRTMGSGWLDPKFIDSTANFLFCFYGLVLLWFDGHFLAEFKPPALLLRLLRVDLLVFLAAIGTLILGHALQGVWLNSVATTLATVLVLVNALSTRAWKRPMDSDNPPIVPRWFIVGMYLFLTSLVLFNRLSVFGTISSDHDVFYLLLLYPLFSSVLVMALLQIRAYRLHKRQHEVAMRLEFAEAAVHSERSRRTEQGRFLSMLTHELKTPVSVAKISLDAMKQTGQENERIARALQNITDVVDRCQISDAFESQRLQMKTEEFDLRELLFERIDLLISPERLKVLEGNQTWICSDSHLVGIVISNLLDNALKYSPDHSTVQVSVLHQTYQTRQGACVVVSNEVGSAGIPDETQIFQKYYRAKAAESQSGSGLGLYLCAGLASLLGGNLRHQAAGDKVEFHFWLPV